MMLIIEDKPMNQCVEARIKELGFTLPERFPIPEGMRINFSWVRIIGNRLLVSGHGPLNPDGSLAQPLGKLGAELTVEEGVKAAQLAAMAMLSTLKRELGDLNRIQRWTKILGMVNSAPEFNLQTPVINGFSDLIVDIFGEERGLHVRSAVGMAALPYDIPVEIEAELEID